MNQATEMNGTGTSGLSPATIRKVALALGGVSMMFAMMMCMCVGLIMIWPDSGSSYDYPEDDYPYDSQYNNSDSSTYSTGTDIYVNGYELTQEEVYSLETIVGRIQPGRYWLDNQGYYGYEGGPAMGNLYTLAEGSGGNGYNRSSDGSLYTGTDGDTGYFFDSDTGCSVVGGEVSC